MKKFFKAIIAIVLVICLGVGGFFGYKFYKNKKNSSEKAAEQEAEKVEIEEVEFVPVSEEDALSRAQWMTMLNEAFQFTDYTEYNSDKINGSFAVATGLEKLGGACLDFYLAGKENTLENKCGLAVDLGLIDENYIDSYIGQEQATSLIENLKALQQSEDYHVVKNDVQLADGVIDGRDWTIDYYNYIELDSTDENNSDSEEEETEDEDSSEETEESEEGANAAFNEEVIASTGDYEPQEGDRIVYLDSDGIMHGGKIINSEERDGGSYDILTTPITKQADYIESYTVAGYVDWSQLERLITESSDQASIAASACAKSEDITVSDPMDLVLKGGIRGDKVEVTEISANGIDIKEVYDALHGETDWLEHGEEDYNGFTGEFEIGLKDIVIYVYAKDDCSVDMEISFTPYVKLDGISGEFTIPIGKGIPLAVGIFGGEFNANIIVSADLGLEIEIAPKDPVVIFSDCDTTGSGVNTSYSDFACDVDNMVNDLIYGSSASFDDFNVQAGASMGILLKLCEVVKVASPGVDVRFVAAGQKLDKVEGYDHACWELKVAGPIVDANLSTSGDTFVDFLTQKTNTKSKWYLNSFNDDSGLLISKYYHLEYESPNPILDPEGNASVCTHYPKDEDHSKDNQIIFSIEDEGETCIDADYVIEINGERFGFEFKNEKYEEQYLAYLDHLSKEDIMGHGTTNSAFSATNYLFTISDWVWIDDDDREKLNMFSPGDLVVVNGCDISDIRIPRIMSSFGGTGFLNSGYVYGDVVGNITVGDESRFEDTIIELGSSSFSFRRPYRNMEKTQEAEK